MMVLAFVLAQPAWAIEDTPDNRAMEAARYLVVVQPKQMMGDLVNRIAQSIPAEKRAGFVSFMNEAIDINKLQTAMTAAMVKTFTAGELKALADFYGSPEGKSALQKMPEYSADMLPTIQQVMNEAMEKSGAVPPAPNAPPAQATPAPPADAAAPKAP
jgi:hypothetical protein